MDTTAPVRPEILAPAGDVPSLLAALAAGADAVYVGLKHFSARMQAENFSVKDLARCVSLAREKKAKVYVALNTLLKPDDLEAAGRLIRRLALGVEPQALIVQDLACFALARQAGFKGELHLSTLANLSHQAGLAAAVQAGAQRVVLPRELNIDEIKAMAAACPQEALAQGFGLEVFIHGALCFCVSGRCYWSSYLGGKSGLRGRCVQPCRRLYIQKNTRARFFSCQDLSLDVLVKSLLAVPEIKAWKIEGRKKTPHYVYYTVSAYKLLRDHGQDPQARKQAEDILLQALGRPGTHYTFLPQKPHSPVSAADKDAPDSGSGLFVGRVTHTPEGTALLKPRVPLIKQDLLRIGSEDEPWHQTLPIRRAVPKGGRLDLPGRKPPRKGAPVFLIDRRESPLVQRIHALKDRLEAVVLPDAVFREPDFRLQLPKPLLGAGKRPKQLQMRVMHALPKGKAGKSVHETGIWLSESAVQGLSRTMYPKLWWWLPPVLWPEEEPAFRNLLQQLLQGGARRFVCNQPWQAALFPALEDLSLAAGPFCNTANALALEQLATLGFSLAVVSPELAREDLLVLPRQSPLPLGIVLAGEWPVGLSRVEPEALKPLTPFTSPMKEPFWVRKFGRNVWIFPGWPLDLTPQRSALQDAGYSLFITLQERRPKDLYEAPRSSSFNWELQLL